MLPGPIHCAWDFGNRANMAIWAFQVGEDGPLIHDFIQMSGCYFEDYLKEVIKRGYDGYDYVPHDAKVPNFETGRTRIETMLGHKRKPVLVANHHVDDGINAVKLMLPKTSFNATNCAPGLEALRQYRQDWDDKARVFKRTPRHDWSSHGSDALRYLAMAWKAIARIPEPPHRHRYLSRLVSSTIPSGPVTSATGKKESGYSQMTRHAIAADEIEAWAG